MSTRLEKLLASIDPARTIDRVSAAVDEAFNSFRNRNPIRTFEDYREYMSKYVQHIEQIVLGIRSNHPYDMEFFWTRYSNLVNSGGDREAWKWNYEKITTGQDGGLYKILKDVAALILDDRSKREISGRVWDFWNSLTNDEKFDTVDEFVRLVGHMLPTKYTGGNAAYLKMNFPRVLESYPQLLMELRRALK
jgi:hypothetical protein